MDIGYDGIRKHSQIEVTRTNGERFRCDTITEQRMTRHIEPGEEGYRADLVDEVPILGLDFIMMTCTFVDRPPEMFYLSDIAEVVYHAEDGPRTTYPPRDQQATEPQS